MSTSLFDFDELIMALGGMGVISVFIVIVLVMLGIAMLAYVVGAYPIYKIAQRRGCSHAWLAWVPVAQSYILGWIADDIEAASGTQAHYWRWWILGCILAPLVVSIIPVIGPFFTMASLVGSVLTYVALYRIYEYYMPENKVLYLVLSIFISLCQIIFLFMANSRSREIHGD